MGGSLHTLTLRANSSGKGTINIVGKGLEFSFFGPALPMTMEPKVIMQLHWDDAATCWEAEYSTSRLNTVARFEAKTP